jgi:CelD/BcsL family acetyltransferase involved in cellulose biosynthesis
MPVLHTERGALNGPQTGNSRLSVRVRHAWSELEQHHSDWNRLLHTNSRSSIFITPEWLSCWWHAFAANKELLMLIFHDDDKNIVAIAPMYAEQQRFGGLPLRVLRFVGAGSGDSDALDFIVAPGYEQACAKAFLDWLTRQNTFDICALETLPDDSAIAQHITTLARGSNRKLYSEAGPNFFIDLPATWPDYLQTLAPAFRPLLTRYPRRLHSRFQVSIARCEQESDLASGLDALFALHQMRWTGRGEPGAFSSAERRDFYLRMAHAFHARGWLEFWLLKLDGQIAAAQFCFRYRDTVYLLQEGFDPKYAAEKVGYALRAHVLQQLIQSGAKRYDFLGGADTYKAKFGARCGTYITLRLALTARGRFCLALRRGKQKLKQSIKRILPARVVAALRGNQTGSPQKQFAGSQE